MSPHLIKTSREYPIKISGYSLIELLLTLFIIGLIVSIATISFPDKTNHKQKNSLQLFSNQINMVLSEAILTRKNWGIRFESEQVDNQIIYKYRWLILEKNNDGLPSWTFATPYELQPENTFPKNHLVTLTVNEENITVNNKESLETQTNNIKPNIVIYNNGELTPFTLTLTPPNEQSNREIVKTTFDSLGRHIISSSVEK